MSIIFFIIIISVIVILHEGGHCSIAKKSGIGVKEFYVGLGPTLFSFKSGETTYSWKLLPIGGLCLFYGMGEGDEGIDYGERSYFKANVWARMATVVAGPFMNFVLAFFLSLFIIGSMGYDPPTIADVMEGYPAEEAGLRSGDEIVRINDKNIDIYRDISLYNMFNDGRKVNVVYRRDGQLRQTDITPIYSEEDGRYLLGFRGPAEYVKGNAFEVIRYSFTEVRYWIEATWKSLGLIFKGKFSKDDLSGPVGIAKAVDDVYDASKPSGAFYVWINMLNITVLLSANLGVMNLLPFPALDGGRLIFCIIEAVTGKRVSTRVEGIFHFAGMCVLLILAVFVMFNDIGKFMM